MNDRFKFRVWAKPDEKTDTEGYYIDDADYMVMHPDGTAEITYYVDDGYAGKIEHFEQDEIIIEQCTGQRDINRKLIYEGDILKDRGNGRWKVIWDDDEIAFCVVSGRKGFVYYLSDFEDCEVIGNIHENTELLKEGQ